MGILVIKTLIKLNKDSSSNYVLLMTVEGWKIWCIKKLLAFLIKTVLGTVGGNQDRLLCI